MDENFDYLFKFLIIGDTCVGKTFVKTTHTIGVEFGSRIIHVLNHAVKLQIWDTAGQERFRAVTKSYYRNASGVLLAYDITNRESFNNVASWLNDARNLAHRNVAILLVGNKKDLESQREVTFSEASKYAKDNGILFMETSALEGNNIEEAFYKTVQTIILQLENGELELDSVTSNINYGMFEKPLLENSESSKSCCGK